MDWLTTFGRVCMAKVRVEESIGTERRSKLYGAVRTISSNATSNKCR